MRGQRQARVVPEALPGAGSWFPTSRIRRLACTERWSHWPQVTQPVRTVGRNLLMRGREGSQRGVA